MSRKGCAAFFLTEKNPNKMSNIINMPCIETTGGNTNVGNCVVNLNAPKGSLLVPRGTTFTRAELVAFIAKAETLLHKDNAFERAHLVKGYKGAEKANVEAGSATWGDGSTVVTSDERVGRTYQMEGVCGSNRLATLNGKHNLYDEIRIFDGNVAVVTKVQQGDGSYIFKGFALSEIYAGQYDEILNQTQAQFPFRLVHELGDEWRNKVAFKPNDGTLLNMVGMQTAELELIPNTPQVAGTYSILVTSSCGSVNLADMFATELVDPTLWIVKNQLGAVVPVDSITVLPSGYFSLVLDDEDAAYTAATKFTVTLAKPSDLAAKEVKWFESTSITFPK